MAKPKPSEEIVSINFTIPKSDKDKWLEYSKSLGFPLARIIKETMNKAIYQNPDLENSNKMQKIISKDIEELKAKMELLSKEYLDEIKKLPIPEDHIESKGRIINLLTDFGPLTREKLQSYLGMDGVELRKILSEMNKSKIIDFNPENQTWRVL